MTIMESKDVKGGQVMTQVTGAKEGPVLIVDDDTSDAMFCECVVDALQPQFPPQLVTSGEDMISYLLGEGLYQDREHYPYPSLILLDLKMPKMDGFEALKWLKSRPDHATVPVVVLSGYVDMAGQVTRAYQLGAHSFLPKPVKREDIESTLSVLKVSI